MYTKRHRTLLSQNKCAKYWPDDKEAPKVFETFLGNIKVTFLGEENTSDYVLRTFTIQRDSVSVLLGWG